MNDDKVDQTRTYTSTSYMNRLLEIDRQSELAELMSGIAHELNQPLAAMATFSQAGVRMLDRNEPLTAESLDVFREISQAALLAGARLQRLRQLFDLAPLQRTPYGMPALIAEVVPVLTKVALEVGARLQIEMPDALPEVFVETLKIQRVLLALVRNAAEASYAIPTDPVIRIDLSADRYFVETGVSDWGCGVCADTLPRIFDPFFTTKPSGHGLGLSSSRVIIESHGGSIGFNNIPTGGIRFWFKLPVATG